MEIDIYDAGDYAWCEIAGRQIYAKTADELSAAASELMKFSSEDSGIDVVKPYMLYPKRDIA